MAVTVIAVRAMIPAVRSIVMLFFSFRFLFRAFPCRQLYNTPFCLLFVIYVIFNAIFVIFDVDFLNKAV